MPNNSTHIIAGMGPAGLVLAHHLQLNLQSVTIVDKRNIVSADSYTRKQRVVLQRDSLEHLFHYLFKRELCLLDKEVNQLSISFNSGIGFTINGFTQSLIEKYPIDYNFWNMLQNSNGITKISELEKYLYHKVTTAGQCALSIISDTNLSDIDALSKLSPMLSLPMYYLIRNLVVQMANGKWQMIIFKLTFYYKK